MRYKLQEEGRKILTQAMVKLIPTQEEEKVHNNVILFTPKKKPVVKRKYTDAEIRSIIKLENQCSSSDEFEVLWDEEEE